MSITYLKKPLKLGTTWAVSIPAHFIKGGFPTDCEYKVTITPTSSINEEPIPITKDEPEPIQQTTSTTVPDNNQEVINKKEEPYIEDLFKTQNLLR